MIKNAEIKNTETVNSFDLNAYLPTKVILSTFTSGSWGTFNADHTIALGWALDYAGANDTRPKSGVGKWNVDKNVLTITGSGGLAGKYDFSKMGKINVGDKFVYAEQYSNLDDGRYVGVFVGDNFTTIDQITGTKYLDQLDKTNKISGWEAYTNSQYGFEIQYPVLNTNAKIYSAEETQFSLPIAEKDLHTNIDEKVLHIVTKIKSDNSKCIGPNYYNKSSDIIINGINFVKNTGGEGAAGHGYQYIDYTTEKNNVCITISFVISSFNDLHIPEYNGGKPFIQYDILKEEPQIDQIISTFKFIK